MKTIFIIWYNVVVIPVLWCGFRIFGLINRKASRGLKGRKDMFLRLGEKIDKLDKNRKRIWFHSSSMGEFEQAKPVIVELKQKYPDIQIIVSFFSSSGYEHSLSYKLADVITYIPFDSYGNASKFIEAVSPSAVIFIRYDVWPNHLWILSAKKIPVFITSATLSPKTYRKLPFIKQFVKCLYNSADFILTVSEKDEITFRSFNLKKPKIESIGDTRFDQVWQRSNQSKSRQLLNSKIYESKKVFVIGSSWGEDEEHLVPALLQLKKETENLLVILVPHEPNERNLERIEQMLNGNISNLRFSHIQQYANETLILVDSVGILFPLYRYAYAAYVGGGFGSGIHNVLEPATFGVPVIFGPRYQNSQEAGALIEAGGGFSIGGSRELLSRLQSLFQDTGKRDECGKKAAGLVQKGMGATDKLLRYLRDIL